MLGKLIKYDMKYLNRFLILLHSFLMISLVLIRVFLTSRIELQTDQEQTEFLFAITFTLCFLIIMAISMGTLLIIAVRFYKNIFTDEGYLTHTLPVKSSQHLISKTVSGSIWAFLNLCLTYIGIYIVAWTPNVQSFFYENKTDIQTELGMTEKYENLSLSTIIAVILLFSIISAISNVIMLYASIALGQLFSSHRIIGSLVAYFVLQIVISVLSLLFIICFGQLTSMIYLAEADALHFSFIAYMSEALRLSCILMCIITIILYPITQYIMKRKINLI
ncbi:MAG: hypothetical protein ACI4S2_08500 [Lachnospiraceae bacterium]